MMIVRRAAALNSDWLCYAMNSPLGKRQVANVQYGTAQKQFNIGDAVGFLFPLPSRPEQDAIAETLTDADTLIDSLEQLLSKQRQIKQGAMQELLTGQRRLLDSLEPWKERPFGVVLERINAKQHQVKASAYQDVGLLPVIDQGKSTVIGYTDRLESKFSCLEGGVIVFGDHTCIVKFVDFDFAVGADGVQLLAAKPGQSTRFHAYQLEFRGVEPTGYNRHFKFLQEREFVCPPEPEQHAIAQVLTDMDLAITALQARLAKARDLKQALMQVLLTGRIRLLPP
jgi:type I restriction enzyme S subunit